MSLPTHTHHVSSPAQHMCQDMPVEPPPCYPDEGGSKGGRERGGREEGREGERRKGEREGGKEGGSEGGREGESIAYLSSYDELDSQQDPSPQEYSL